MVSTPIKRLALGCVVALTFAACSGSGSYFAPVAAVINGVEISEGRIADDFAVAIQDPQLAELFEGPDADANRIEAYRQLLSQLIQRQMLLQEAQRRGITVPDEEVQTQLDATVQGQGGADAFADILNEAGVSLDYVETRIIEETITEQVVGAIAGEVELTESEIREAYEANKETYTEQLHLAHILVCGDFDPSAGRCNATESDLQTAQDVAERAREGEDFADLARQFTVDPSGVDNGGDLGWSGRGQFVPDFEEAAFALESEGDISDPVETEFGHHVIKLLEKGRPEEEALAEVEQNLLGPAREQAIQAWLRQALQDAEIRINPRYGRFDPSTLSVVAAE